MTRGEEGVDNSMLRPHKRTLKDYHYCFYGRDFNKQEVDDGGLYRLLCSFLSKYKMKIFPLVEVGKWLWPEIVRGMERSAFSIFETESANRNVHIELGYALARNLNVILLVPKNEEKSGDYRNYLPSDLAGLIQIRYEHIEDLEKKLGEEIPKRYHSVEERLRIALRSVADIDSAYFDILLKLAANQRIRFSELVGMARIRNSASSNTCLAQFLRKYDEVMVPYSECELDSASLGIDEDYKEWIIQWFGKR